MSRVRAAAAKNTKSATAPDGSAALGDAPLVLEQPLLALEPAAVARERAAFADHAVTGHDNADRILAVGESHRTRGLGVANAARQLAIALGNPERDLGQRFPHRVLKRTALAGDLDLEALQLAGEVSLQLRAHVSKRPVVLLATAGRRWLMSVRLHVEAGQRSLVTEQEQRADRRL